MKPLSLFEKLCAAPPDGSLPPFFHVPVQQYALSGVETDRELTEAEQTLWRETILLGYVMNKRSDLYFGDLHIPALLSPELLAFLNEEVAKIEGLPVTRFMQLMCRRLSPYDRLYDLKKKRGVQKLYADLCGALGMVLQLPPELIPEAASHCMSEPAPAVAPAGGQGVFITRLMMEIFRMAGVREGQWNDPAFTAQMVKEFFARAYPTLALPAALARAHEEMAARAGLKVASLAEVRMRPRYVLAAPKPLPVEASQADLNLMGWDDPFQKMQHVGARLTGVLKFSKLRTVRVPSYGEALRAGKGQPLQKAVGPINLIPCQMDHLGDYFLRQGLENFEGRYNIGLCSWETSKLPRIYKAALPLLDEIWVASEFEKQLFEKEASCPVRVMPPAINHAPPAATVSRATLELPEGAFIFVTAFECQDWLARKNPLAVIQAFKQAFKSDEKAILVIKTRGISKTIVSKEEGHIFRLMKAWEDPRIHVFHDDFSDAEMNGLLNLCDAYVSLHRCSAFGATIAETLALGKPVIATEGSGPADYLSEKIGYPVAASPCEVVFDAYHYLDKEVGHKWADPEIASAVATMREVFKNPVAAKIRAQEGQRLIQARYSAEAAAKAIEARITEILQKSAARAA